MASLFKKITYYTITILLASCSANLAMGEIKGITITNSLNCQMSLVNGDDDTKLITEIESAGMSNNGYSVELCVNKGKAIILNSSSILCGCKNSTITIAPTDLVNYNTFTIKHSPITKSLGQYCDIEFSTQDDTTYAFSQECSEYTGA